MRNVESQEVFLISSPNLDWLQIRRYLRLVGGESWADRVTSDPTMVDAEALVEFSGKFCYRSWEAGLNPNVSTVSEDSLAYHGNILASGHGSVLEHANFTFILHDVSRVFTHEIVRHRVGVAISQESLRFVRLDDIPFWFPEWVRNDYELMVRAHQLLEEMEVFQAWMADHFGLDDDSVPFAEKKHKTSFMRRFAPIGLATGMVWTVNVRAIRHVIAMRTNLAAEEEARLVLDKVAELALRAVPALMQDYSPDENREWIPEFLKV